MGWKGMGLAYGGALSSLGRGCKGCTSSNSPARLPGMWCGSLTKYKLSYDNNWYADDTLWSNGRWWNIATICQYFDQSRLGERNEFAETIQNLDLMGGPNVFPYLPPTRTSAARRNRRSKRKHRRNLSWNWPGLSTRDSIDMHKWYTIK